MKMNLIKLVGLLGLLTGAVFSSTASAQFYLGAGAGESHISGADGSTVVAGVPATGTGGNKWQGMWKLYGGYQFTPNWGVEGQYSDLGRRTYNVQLGAPINLGGSAKFKTDEWGLAATGTLPLSNGFSLLGKLGATRNHVGGGNLTIAGIPFATGGSNKTSLLAGIGAGYDINKNFGVRLEYENYGKISSNGFLGNSSVKADSVSISLKYSF